MATNLISTYRPTLATITRPFHYLTAGVISTGTVTITTAGVVSLYPASGSWSNVVAYVFCGHIGYAINTVA